MNWGALAGGFAQTFDPKAVGGAINQTWASSKEESALEEAGKKRDSALKDLDAAREAGNRPAPKAKPVAIPTGDQVNTGVDTVSGATPSASAMQVKPGDLTFPEKISDSQYEARKNAIMSQYDTDRKQARIDYFRRRGNEEARMRAEDDLENQKWHQSQVNLYRDVMDGNPEATKRLVGYMNASMGNGQRLVMNNDGTMSLMGADGKPVQANFKPSPQQINEAFTNYYNMAKFVHDGGFGEYLGNAKAIQDMKLGRDKVAMARETLDETKRHNRATEDNTRTANNQRHAATMAGLELDKQVADARTRYYNSKSQPEPKQWHFGEPDENGRIPIRSRENGELVGYQEPDGTIVPFGSTLEIEHQNAASAQKLGLQYSISPITGRGVFHDGQGNAFTPEEVAARLAPQESSGQGERTAIPHKVPTAAEFAAYDQKGREAIRRAEEGAIRTPTLGGVAGAAWDAMKRPGREMTPQETLEAVRRGELQ